MEGSFFRGVYIAGKDLGEKKFVSIPNAPMLQTISFGKTLDQLAVCDPATHNPKDFQKPCSREAFSGNASTSWNSWSARPNIFTPAHPTGGRRPCSNPCTVALSWHSRLAHLSRWLFSRCQTSRLRQELAHQVRLAIRSRFRCWTDYAFQKLLLSNVAFKRLSVWRPTILHFH